MPINVTGLLIHTAVWALALYGALDLMAFPRG